MLEEHELLSFLHVQKVDVFQPVCVLLDLMLLHVSIHHAAFQVKHSFDVGRVALHCETHQNEVNWALAFNLYRVDPVNPCQ